jgi:hypothetical protein
MAAVVGIKWDILNPSGKMQRITFSARNARDDAASLNRFLRRINKGGRGKTGTMTGAGGRPGGGFDPASNRQFCVAKMTYSKKMGSHKKFVSVYMPQHNKETVGEKPRLFGTPGYEQHMTGKHFKFIISPDSQQVDTEMLVTLLVKRMEAETGHTFHWQAAAHTDTAQKHAHLLINGADQSGADIRFARHFINNRVRELSQDICTSLAGERTAEQKAVYAERSIESKRYTKHDEGIASHAMPTLNPASKEQWPQTVWYRSETERRRLGELAKIGVARFAGEGAYELEKDWGDTLKTMGRYNTFLVEKQKDRNLHLWRPADGKITGSVKYVYRMNDEDVWNNAVVIANKQTGGNWYVPLFNPAGSNLVGKEITLEGGMDARGKAKVKMQIVKAAQNTAFTTRDAQKPVTKPDRTPPETDLKATGGYASER